MILKKGDKFQVRSRAGKLLGTHETREKALRQLAAVEANYAAKKDKK